VCRGKGDLWGGLEFGFGMGKGEGKWDDMVKWNDMVK
jgi:hypothetical protein